MTPTSSSSQQREAQIQAFVKEMISFSEVAETTLKKIESHLLENRELFSVYTEHMVAIRGTALQLGFPEIAGIAELGEEISVKATQADSRSVLRKCVGSLWDAQTTIQYMLENHMEATNEEREILINRLEKTLKSLGGARLSVDSEDIEKLLQQHSTK